MFFNSEALDIVLLFTAIIKSHTFNPALAAAELLSTFINTAPILPLYKFDKLWGDVLSKN